MHNGQMSGYKVVDTQFELRRDVVSLAQIVHAPIKQPTGDVKTFILSANISRHKSEKWAWSNEALPTRPITSSTRLQVSSSAGDFLSTVCPGQTGLRGVWKRSPGQRRH